LERNISAKPVSDDAKRSDTSKWFVVGRNQVPWRMRCRSVCQHVLDGRLIVRPAGVIAEIVISQFPAFQRVEQPIPEAAYLLAGRHMEEQLDQAHSRVDQHALEIVDFAVGAPPFVTSRKPSYAFHQHAAVPRTVKGDDLSSLR